MTSNGNNERKDIGIRKGIGTLNFFMHVPLKKNRRIIFKKFKQKLTQCLRMRSKLLRLIVPISWSCSLPLKCTKDTLSTKDIMPKAMKEMNKRLTRKYTRDEVAKALKQMGPLKSLGPNEFGACFYQNHWKTIGDNVCKAVLMLLQSEGMTL